MRCASVPEIDPEVDHPSKLDEQLAWLEAARLFPEVTSPMTCGLAFGGRPAIEGLCPFCHLKREGTSFPLV